MIGLTIEVVQELTLVPSRKRIDNVERFDLSQGRSNHFVRAINDLNEQTRELIAVVNAVEKLTHKCVAVESFNCISDIFLRKRCGAL
jgi:hypothetical protein